MQLIDLMRVENSLAEALKIVRRQIADVVGRAAPPQTWSS